MWEIYRTKLDHLSKYEKKLLTLEYYDKRISNSKLLSKYNIEGVLPKNLYRCFTGDISNKLCKYCHQKMMTLPFSNIEEEQNGYECFACGNAEFTTSNSTIHSLSCEENNKEILFESKCSNRAISVQLNDLIQQRYSEHTLVINSLNDLSITELIELAAFLELYIDENYNYTVPICNMPGKLTPDVEWNRRLVRTLYNKEYIAISEISPIEAFVSLHDNKIFEKIHFNKVCFYPTFHSNYKCMLKKLLSGDLIEYFSEKSKEDYDLLIIEMYELWKKIGVSECIEFLEYQMSRLNFQIQLGQKTHDMFSDFLNVLSVSEIHSIIYGGITYACRVREEKKIYGRYASNTAISIIRSTGEKVITGHWNKKSFNRPYNIQQSSISKYFFHNVLKINESAFNITPKINMIEEVLQSYINQIN